MKGGLKILKRDRRDLKAGVLLKFPKLEELPKNGIGILKPLGIKDQGNDDTCAARSSDAVSEDQELVPLCDYFTFAQAKFIEGDPFDWGLQLRSVAKSHTKAGALAQVDCPYCPTDTHNLERDRDWNNWPQKDELLELAQKHKKASYFSVAGPYDLFDNFRSIFYLGRNDKQSSFTGALWKQIWTHAPNGLIPKFDLDKGIFGHSFKIYDWIEIEGEPYLVAQLSNGTGIGNKGIFYFSRTTVNKELGQYGAFTFSDMPIEQAKKVGWSFWIKVLNILKIWWEEIMK